MNRDIYETITARFIEQLKRGTVPWQKPWLGVQNIISRKPYRGINSLLFGSAEFQSPFWLTFKQSLDLGGHVKKGEKSTPVIYYKILEKRDEAGKILLHEDGRPARIPFLRWANVFNLDQTEGIQAPTITASKSLTQPHEKAAAIVENARLYPIHHAGFAACYSRASGATHPHHRCHAPRTRVYCHRGIDLQRCRLGRRGGRSHQCRGAHWDQVSCRIRSAHWAHCLWGSGHGLSPHEAPVVSAQLAALGFTKAVFGLEAQRLADANTIEKLCERYARALETHRDDHVVPE
jgi:N-terminal domain of anti-restriction factor ArdC